MQPLENNPDQVRSGEGRRRVRWRGLAMLFICAVAVGVLFSIKSGVVPPIAGLIVTAVVFLSLFWQMRARLPSVLLVFATVLLVGVVATHKPPKVRADRLLASEGDR